MSVKDFLQSWPDCRLQKTFPTTSSLLQLIRKNGPFLRLQKGVHDKVSWKKKPLWQKLGATIAIFWVIQGYFSKFCWLFPTQSQVSLQKWFSIAWFFSFTRWVYESTYKLQRRVLMSWRQLWLPQFSYFIRHATKCANLIRLPQVSHSVGRAQKSV